MKRGKRYRNAKEKVEKREYSVTEAIVFVKDNATAKFDETAELSIRLGIDPRKSDQMVRGTVFLPHGTGKKIRILVFVTEEKEDEAKETGADYVGGEELIEKIKNGWADFDLAISVPEMMSKVGKIGKILGPRGLMPNPKVGTVTKDIKKAVNDARKGRIEFKVDKTGNLHVPIGKVSFSTEHMEENLLEVLREVVRLKPASTKGTYIKNLNLCSSMGPGITINAQEIIRELR
ncbi:MAG: 50S ribosomal protein L1 [Candidatus Cloacimonadota bacterium]|nr:MAG: 50S ribosomal protein L1 [Candidatus Cloacimonadota bacterium]